MCWHLLHERPLSKYIHTEKRSEKMSNENSLQINGGTVEGFLLHRQVMKVYSLPDYRTQLKNLLQNHDSLCFCWLFYSALIATILTQLFNNKNNITLWKKLLKYEQILYFIVHCICFYVKNTWHLKWFFDISSN